MQELEINIKTFVGLLESNTYLVYNDNGSAMLIDAGAPCHEIKDFAYKNNLSIKHIVLTHGHYDHVDFISSYINEFSSAKVYCHESELKVLKNPEANVSALLGLSKVYNYEYTTLNDGDELLLDDIKFTVLNYPGHTPGSICLLCSEQKIMFTGDVLFATSYGRTDFLYGSTRDMMNSLRAISRLDGDITIYPGHYNSAKLRSIFRM